MSFLKMGFSVSGSSNLLVDFRGNRDFRVCSSIGHLQFKESNSKEMWGKTLDFSDQRGVKILSIKAPKLDPVQAQSTISFPKSEMVGEIPPAKHDRDHIVDPLLDSVKWDEKGLAVAIAQNVDTGAVLMQGFINREALLKTVSSRKATFYSRSRSTLWTKGETSLNFINVSDVFLDCDRDSIIYLGKPDGPTCHTGAQTCYYTSINDALNDPQVDGNKLPLTTLYALESTIAKRREELSKNSDGKPSWTKRLLTDKKLLCSKIREEADELCRTLEENEDKSRTASEMADLLYHAMVLLARKEVNIEDVLQVLRLRFAQSGIEEKSSRKS